MEKSKKSFYKKWWFILGVIIVIIGVTGGINSKIKKAAEQKAAYIWPDTELVSLLPRPDSEQGRINMENEDYFSIEIYKVSKDGFEKYVGDCKNSGFTVDYMKYDDSYLADNEVGYSLSLSYDEKEEILRIMLNAPDEDSLPAQKAENNSGVEPEKNGDVDTDETLKKSQESPELAESNSSEPVEKSQETEPAPETLEASGDIRPEFKEMLDDYEAFMNGYCDFMKKYTESDDILSMTADYLKLVQDEAEWIEKIDNLEEEEMNDAEVKYYAEVTLRVSQKLLETAH